MWVCVYLCVHVYMCVCISVWLSMCVRMYVCVCINCPELSHALLYSFSESLRPLYSILFLFNLFFYQIFSLLAMLTLQDLNLHFCKLSKIRTQHSWRQEMTTTSHPCHLIRNPVKWKISMMMMIDNYYRRYYYFYDVKLRIWLLISSLQERMTIMMKVVFTNMHW